MALEPEAEPNQAQTSARGQTRPQLARQVVQLLTAYNGVPAESVKQETLDKLHADLARVVRPELIGRWSAATAPETRMKDLTRELESQKLVLGFREENERGIRVPRAALYELTAERKNFAAQDAGAFAGLFPPNLSVKVWDGKLLVSPSRAFLQFGVTSQTEAGNSYAIVLPDEIRKGAALLPGMDVRNDMQEVAANEGISALLQQAYSRKHPNSRLGPMAVTGTFGRLTGTEVNEALSDYASVLHSSQQGIPAARALLQSQLVVANYRYSAKILQTALASVRARPESIGLSPDAKIPDAGSLLQLVEKSPVNVREAFRKTVLAEYEKSLRPPLTALLR